MTDIKLTKRQVDVLRILSINKYAHLRESDDNVEIWSAEYPKVKGKISKVMCSQFYKFRITRNTKKKLATSGFLKDAREATATQVIFIISDKGKQYLKELGK
jgi:hypothetical protein